MLSSTEENYLKALIHLSVEKGVKDSGTNELAGVLNLKPATVNVMLKKLREKKYVSYEKYGRITLTSTGKKIAIEIIRKHRLWETFLFEKLGFDWDEVHEVAEQLEHIQSKKLIDELDRFLGFPMVDPHGEIIPNAKGEIRSVPKQLMSSVLEKRTYVITGVKNDDTSFLKYLEKLGCRIGKSFQVKGIQSFDSSIEIDIDGKSTLITSEVAAHVFVKPRRTS